MGYKVGLTDLARDDLGEAVRLIAIEGENPDAALRMGHELLEAALSLAMAIVANICAIITMVWMTTTDTGTMMKM
jgi:hypothetical protein